MEETNKADKTEDLQPRHLPDELITQQILPWLPIKSLTQCKLISKEWYSSISSPTFILNHFQKSLFSESSPPLESLLIQSDNKYYLYSCDLGDNVEVGNNLIELNVDFNVDVSDKIRLEGCINGLVCLTEVYGKYFILWNPATNKFHKYYPENYQLSYPFSDSKAHVNWGFGYLSTLDDYKVIRIMMPVVNGRYMITYDVFSLRNNSWRVIESGLPRSFFVERSRYVDDTVYWKVFYDCDAVHSRTKIVAFDLKFETFSLFPMWALSRKTTPICVIGGCLSKCDLISEKDLIINILKPSGRLASVRVSCDFNLSIYIRDAIGFTKTGKIFIVHDSKLLCLGLADLSSTELLMTFESEPSNHIEGYVPTQISPLPRVELPNASGQQVA